MSQEGFSKVTSQPNFMKAGGASRLYLGKNPLRRIFFWGKAWIEKMRILVLLRRHGRRRYRFFAFFDVKKRGFACKPSRYAFAGRPQKIQARSVGRIIHPLKCFCSLLWILDD